MKLSFSCSNLDRRWEFNSSCFPINSFYSLHFQSSTELAHKSIAFIFWEITRNPATLNTTMMFQFKSLLFLSSVFVGVIVASAIPIAEPVPVPVPGPDPVSHMDSFKDLLAPRANKRPKHNPDCPSTIPVNQNLCNSGSPYCCSGTGPGAVCGPSATTNCASTTICCINTNGVSWKDFRHRYFANLTTDANLRRRDWLHWTSDDQHQHRFVRVSWLIKRVVGTKQRSDGIVKDSVDLRAFNRQYIVCSFEQNCRLKITQTGYLGQSWIQFREYPWSPIDVWCRITDMESEGSSQMNSLWSLHLIIYIRAFANKDRRILEL